MEMVGPRSLLIGEPLAADLANTLVVDEDGDAVDFLVTLGGLSDWLKAEGKRLDGWAPVTHEDLSDFLAMRAAIRELFDALVGGGVPSEDVVRVINAASARAPAYPELDCSGARPQIRERGLGGGAAAALAAVARSAIDVAGGPNRERLRVCEAPGCSRLFVATNPRRRWCSESCGNRARVARHYERHRASRK